MNTQWKLVPIEPTREMLVAALKTNGACPIYAAMLAAAPPPPTGGEADVIGYRVRYEQNPEAEYLMYQEPEGLYSSEAIILLSDHRALVARLMAEREALQLLLNAADQRADDLQEDRQKLIAYGRSCGLDEAATVCTRMAHEAYFPPGSRFKHFTPKAQTRLGNLLIEAANAIASLPDGPYDRFKARQQKTAEKSASA